MNDNLHQSISGREDGTRIESRVLEERMQQAVADGCRQLEVEAFGQHGIGGRLWRAGEEPVHVRITGHAGQRVGAMGYANTTIEVLGPSSDDVGWLNAGARIIVHGNASNGVGNAMAQGKIYVAGNIGARGMTMTKHNPRFDPPELWVLGSVGDYFGEFMAGGVAVVCGIEAQDPDNVLGYRPLVGMVGGRVFFRGPIKGFSQADARLIPVEDDDYQWLVENLEAFLSAINRLDLLQGLSRRDQWQLLRARTAQEKRGRQLMSMADYKTRGWEAELGRGGLIGDLTTLDRSPIGLIVGGELRRYVPVWENRKYLAPCEATCPTGIPVQQRWQLVRDGRVDEAVDLALAYTPFPATVCGYLCPSPCMQACTRQQSIMAPVDVRQLGRASLAAGLPDLPETSGRRVAVIGGGPAGISVAWQLRMRGHEATVYDLSETLGGKIASVIPAARIPGEVVSAELERVRKVIPHIHLQQKLSREELAQLREDYDFVVIATGAAKPRMLDVPGKERLITASDFLADAKAGRARVGERLVVIGAGNVGCDVATEAARLGARSLLLIDVQEPASFGAERRAAEAAGARFRWPCFTREITEEGVVLDDGELIPADTVVISIGDVPDLDFLPDDIATERGFVAVNAFGQTSDPKIFAIGDIVRPGLLTDAIGAGRRAAEAIGDMLEGKRPSANLQQVIDTSRVKLEYFDPRLTDFEDLEHCGSQCSSCGSCRDCGVCATICPPAAISRIETEEGGFEYVVDADKCIACGFCAGACPCGIWNLVENDPLV